MSSPKRRDRRVRAVLPVRVSSSDGSLRLNSTAACTLDIAARGARLGGINFFGEMGTIVTVERGVQRANFKVVWIGSPGTAIQGQIGLESLEPVRSLWGVNMPVEQVDSYTPVQSGLPPARPAASASTKNNVSAIDEKQRNLSLKRFLCKGEVEYRREAQQAVFLKGKLRDIGQRGLFLITREKLPVNTRVALTVTTDMGSLPLRGIIRTTEAMGMYVEFVDLQDEHVTGLYEMILKIAN
jgi:PilZ domain-containing protein